MEEALKTRLCIVRHGETEENISHIFQGHLPGTLTENGRSQAVTLRKTVDVSVFDAIVSSDLRRATDTVTILLDGKVPRDWVRSALFREKDWGSLTGQVVGKADFDAFPSDVETKEILYDRAGKALCFLQDKYAGKTVLVVSHGLFLQSFMARIARVPLEQVGSMRRLGNCECRWMEI